MKPEAYSTDLRASLAFVTVKKRIRICGRPAVPNIRPSASDTAVTGSGISLPGLIIDQPLLCAATAFSTTVV